jgi:parallel beta-helix repeat protein
MVFNVRKEVVLILCLIALMCPLVYMRFNPVEVKSSNGSGPVHNTTTGQNYTTIQEAINNASFGDAIVVESGMYNEDVVVNQTVSLTGEDKHNTIVNGSGNAPVFYIRRDEVIVSNFTMQNNNMGTWAGVYIGSYRSDSNVSCSIIRNCSVGVRCWEYSESNFIVENEIVNCKTGVKDRYSSGNVIIGNNISMCSEYGVDVEGSYDTVVQGNTISQCWGGIYLSYGSQRTVIADNHISSGDGGIGLDASSHNTITNNRIEHCNLSGMYLGEALWTGSNHNFVTNNTISFSTQGDGLFIYGSTGNNLSDNTMMNNLYNFGVEGEELSDFIHSVDTSNTVDGKPIYYWIDDQNSSVPLDAGYVGLVNSTRIVVENLSLTSNRQGVLLAFSSDSNVSRNRIANNYYGIHLWNSSNYNVVYDNDLVQNEYGVWLGPCYNNTFYHNNFTDNTEQAHIDSFGYANFWNETYPTGGNSWSDYEDQYPEAEDVYDGPNQDQPDPDGDGFWDTPYEIDGNNIDHLPIIPEFPSLLILPLLACITLVAVIAKRKGEHRRR